MDSKAQRKYDKFIDQFKRISRENGINREQGRILFSNIQDKINYNSIEGLFMIFVKKYLLFADHALITEIELCKNTNK